MFGFGWVGGSRQNGCSDLKIHWFQKHVFAHCNAKKTFLLNHNVLFVIDCAIMWCLEYPMGELVPTMGPYPRPMDILLQMFRFLGEWMGHHKSNIVRKYSGENYFSNNEINIFLQLSIFYYLTAKTPLQAM